MSSMQELVQQVQALEAATTDLLEATNVSKQTLDSSVDAAKGSAEAAANAEAIATPACNDAVTAKNESVKAKEEALAIVHNDEGSVEPVSGNYPVSDANGHLDVNWTPLLAAMYPYSGVIGSVDKGDLFTFLQDNADRANRFFLQRSQTFNINGRFVKLSETFATTVTLPAAESTAARATAFDDIFIDWNGNVVTHRSITPHRTTTGYDRDLIATEHGYTKVQAGLYRTDDSATYLLLLGRVSRRNQGAYHPVYNPEGTTTIYRDDGTTSPGKWYVPDRFTISSAEDCFNFTEKVYSSGGSIVNQNPWDVGRPISQPYDAIYATDFTPLYYSAKNIIDRQALLFDSFNRAVAGETFSGAEGTTDSLNKVFSDTITSHFTFFITGRQWGDSSRVSFDSFNFKGQLDTDKLEVWGGASSGGLSYYKLDGFVVSQSGQVYKTVAYEDFDKGLIYLDSIYGNVVDDLTGGDATFTFYHQEKSDAARPEFLAVDIIGAQSAMPAEWLTEGIPGNWLAVDENGNSLIPDGTLYDAKLSRKCLECYLVLYTTDNGISWSDVTSLHESLAEGAGNTLGSLTTPSEGCLMTFYRTSANPFELADTVTHTSLYDMAYAVNDQNAPLIHNLINKITVNPGSNNRNFLPLTSIGLNVGANSLNSSNFTSPTAHPAVSLTEVNPAGKVLGVLSDVDDTLVLQCVYKELKHNGTSWGDDNKFNIVDNQSTVTDLNGESVIVGQKRVELPYQFDGLQL